MNSLELSCFCIMFIYIYTHGCGPPFYHLDTAHVIYKWRVLHTWWQVTLVMTTPRIVLACFPIVIPSNLNNAGSCFMACSDNSSLFKWSRKSCQNTHDVWVSWGIFTKSLIVPIERIWLNLGIVFILWWSYMYDSYLIMSIIWHVYKGI